MFSMKKLESQLNMLAFCDYIKIAGAIMEN
jgi:hypothetical protein